MKLLNVSLLVMISTSLMGSTLATASTEAARKPIPCRDRLALVGTNGIMGGSALLASGLIVVGTFGGGIGGIALSGFLLGGGESALVNGINKRKLMKLIDQANEGDGRILNRYYKKYVRVAERMNAKAIKTNGLVHAIMAKDVFAKAIVESDLNGSICKPVEINTMMASPSRKDVAVFVYDLNDPAKEAAND